MANQILLNFAVPFTEIIGTGEVDTSYLRKAAIVVVPKEGAQAGISEVYDSQGLAAITNNTEGSSFFDGGLNRIFVIAVADLDDVNQVLDDNENKFFTLHVSNDFTDAEVKAKAFNFDGVISHEFESQADAKAFAVKSCAGVSSSATSGHGVCFALGKLLSTLSFWGNQQYIDYAGGQDIEVISSLGQAESYFDDRLTFWLFDEDEGTKLAGFFCGGDAITEKYISEELKLKIQSNAIGYISRNMPMNVQSMRVALQNELQAQVNEYVDSNYLDSDGVNQIIVSKSDREFWVKGTLNVKHAKPIWRMAITAIKE